jgi:hypothetical protein
MSENKRFTVNGYGRICDKGHEINQEVVCIKLNVFCEIMDKLVVKNEQLTSTNMEYEDALARLEEQLKQQKRFLKIHDDYYIQYGDDKELFDLHKPADIRSLCIILNREHGFSELQCEYNDEEHRE